MATTSFSLEKTYADCIDRDGNCFILYDASLQVFFIRVHYASMLFSDATNKVIERRSTRKSVLSNQLALFSFKHERLKISGVWRGIAKPEILELLCYSPQHALVWHCLHPKALTEIGFNGIEIRGWGYAETIRLTLQPWKLPIDQLLWGRFLSVTDTVTWINWSGSHPLNKLFHNGILYEDATFETDKLVFNKGLMMLVFTDGSVIRKGKLSEVLSGWSWLKLFFRQSILQSEEYKYKAMGCLSVGEQVLSTGWTIYEKVLWHK